MVRQCRRFLASLLAGLIFAAGCAPLVREPRQVLDPGTGITLMVADQPLILARDRRDLAAQARDYLTLLAAEINESGRRQLVLVVHQWSTIDARARAAQSLAELPLLIVADGRDLRLVPMNRPALLSANQGAVLGRPEDADVTTTCYPIDVESLHFLATSNRITAVFPQGNPALPYALWRDGRGAQLRLLEALGH